MKEHSYWPHLKCHKQFMRQKSKFEQIGPKIRTSALLEYLYSRHFAGAESYIEMLQFFVQNPNLGKLVPKLKSCLVYLKICTQV